MKEPLQHILQLLARPIEFACRNDAARSSHVKDLGPYVAKQVLHALSQQVFSAHVEVELLSIRHLFRDYHEGLPREKRKRLLGEALGILRRLSSGEVSQPAVPKPMETARAPRRAPRGQALWNMSIQFAKGVGPRRALLFETRGVKTVEDALWYLPWRYEDRSVMTPISRLQPGTRATICGTLVAVQVKRTARRGMTILEVMVEDATGSLPCVYFNQPYLENKFTQGARVMMCGVVSAGRRKWGDVQMESPQYEILGDETDVPLHVGRIVPVYHETRGLASRQIRTTIKGLLQTYLDSVEELIPPETLARQALPVLGEAIGEVHFPPAHTPLETLERGVTGAHQRLAFEELFVLEVALALRQRSVKEEVKGIEFDVGTPLLASLQASLPFRLTEAQQRVSSEIARDMASRLPMNRLIQGDVGCGKTVVALQAMVIACGSGYQAALMVPTEILAEQHYLSMRGLLASLGLTTVLLKSRGNRQTRGTTIREIESGDAKVVIGTHALIQKGVRFRRLGLTVIDEQQKFGVLQRKTLVEKGYRPDVLVLTATPIPRTLAMTVYGDLDVSIIDSLPPGRLPIRTLLFSEAQRRKVYSLVRDELTVGRQAYVVYPLVEESEKVDLQAALQGAERLQAEEFASFTVGVLHGRMKTVDKERTMAAFKAGEIHLLVATTVVEVGVDVPNATVMVIEHADRFGLAQLHQLRGRVGRGPERSSCLLLMSGQASLPSHEQRASAARRRLEALVKSSDGFVIAEEDLRIRGPGEFFGVRQWGLPEFRAANLIRDAGLLERARREAFDLVAGDPGLRRPDHQALRRAILRRWQAKLDLGSIS